jgi:hypothetical protein
VTDRTDYSDVADLGVDAEKRARLYEAQTECAVVWTNSAGWPVGVLHRFVWHEDRFWVTCAAQRKRVPALRDRPQSCVIVSSEGTWLGGDVTTTAKTLATVHDDDAVRSWFYPRLAERQRSDDDDRAEFLRRLDTPGRVIIELEPVDWITYDGVRLESSLRGIEYDPSLVKPSRNRREPPDGISTTSLD